MPLQGPNRNRLMGVLPPGGIMWGFWDTLFRRRQPVSTAPLAGMAKDIERHVDDLANDLFVSYREVLLGEPIVYIVFAVWGAKKNGTLTGTQREINARIVPILDDIERILALDQATAQQRYAVNYLLRSLLISRITFMIEHFKYSLATQPDKRGVPSASLSPDVLSDEWLNNLTTTNSESWRRKFNGGGGPDR